MFYLSSMALKPVSVPVLLQQPHDKELPEDIDPVRQKRQNKSKIKFCDLIGKIINNSFLVKLKINLNNFFSRMPY